VQQGSGEMTDAPSPAVRKNVSPSHRVKPTYPRTALRDGVSGKVIVWLRVAPDGSVTGLEIKESRPPRVFDAEVRRALMQWKFAPEPVGFIAEIEVEFNLTDR
jgi:protein TonB